MNGRAEEEFAMRSRSECPQCGAAQSFTDWRNGVKRCQKDACKGAVLRPAKVWGMVQESFLSRWAEFNIKREKNLAKLDAETLPPFRVTHRVKYIKVGAGGGRSRCGAGAGARAVGNDAVFVPVYLESALTSAPPSPQGVGKVDEPIPVPHWVDVAEGFFERTAAVEERIKARVAEAAVNAAEAASKVTIQALKARPYKFSQPLPSFHERQAAAAARGNLTCEERLAMYGD